MTAPVCGLDFSLRAVHVALVSGPTLLSAKRYALGPTPTTQAGVITSLAMSLFEEHGALPVYMERPWLLRGPRMNPQTTIELALLVGAIRGIFIASGHTVELIAPDAWRSIVLDHYDRDRASKKASAIRTARREFPGIGNIDDNTADAIMLACYGRQVQKRDQLVRAS